MNRTIIYYTSNRENPIFEERIRKTLLENCGDIPIISVSQKPIDLGKNICVGEVGHSYLNEYRQILIGAKEAETEYIVTAEADFLYPPEYFNYNPTGADIYRYNNVWIVFKKGVSKGYKTTPSYGAQICRREYLIREIEKYLEGQPEWIDGVKTISGKKDYNVAPFEPFGNEVPCISFKTSDGMSRRCHFLHGEENMSRYLPYWGDIRELRLKYLW